MPFTDRQISALKPKQERYEKVEPGRTGLRIRVTPRGVKTWGYLYRFEGRQKRLVFGTYPVMGVAKAHSALADAREKLLAGVDPGAVVAEDRAAERNAETMADLVAEYIERHAKPNMRDATIAEEIRILHREIVPFLGSRKAEKVSRRDLNLLLDEIEARGVPTMRNRVKSVLTRLFKFAKRRGIITSSPADDIEGLSEGPERERFLTMPEIRSLWFGLDGIAVSPSSRLAVRFLIATGQRRAEVCGITWTEIDKTEALWMLPGKRAKNGRENIIPLPPFIMGLVAEAEKLRDDPPPNTSEPSPYLFPGRSPDKPIARKSTTMAIHKNRTELGLVGSEDPDKPKTYGGATIHDLRRTFSTWHAEIGNPPYIVEALLNHKLPGVAGLYNRAEYLALRREAMERWCDWLQLVIAGEFEAAKKMQGADIVPLTEVA